MIVRTAPEPTWAAFTGPLPQNGGAKTETARSTNGSLAEREGWQALIEGELASWARDPHALEDDGIEPPTEAILQLAAQVAGELRDAGLPAPRRVGATGDGGVVFARQDGPLLSTIEVAADGSVELTVLQDNRLLSRRRLR